jgi:NifU-like protein involved in Fe-S cluster formation
MATDSDLIRLYSARILALAADMPLTTRLTAPDATAKRRSPLCGSTVTVDLTLEDGQIAAFGQEVRACALGQAAASVVGQAILGRSRDQVQAARDQLWAMLREGGPAPLPPFDGLSVLEPAKDHRNRHASIMLALEATLEAFDQAARARATA